MKRFNLLVVNSGTDTPHRMRKVAMKILKKRFAFEVESMEEGLDLLDRLNIDMLMVDLDRCPVNFKILAARYPNLKVYGAVQSYGSHPVPVNDNQMVFLKETVAKELREELKGKSKAKTEKKALFPRMDRSTPIRTGSSDFDFVELVASH